MINKYQPHVIVLPEDQANEQIANGFLLEPALDPRRIQVLPVAGGWGAVRDSFLREHNAAMKKYRERRMVLLVDFDGQSDRPEQVLSAVDPALREQVFVIGSLSEPEDLRSDLGSYEQIGRLIARDCARQATTTWEHPSLRHNLPELSRLMTHIRPILFS